MGYLGPAEPREPFTTASSCVPSSTLFYHGYDKEARSFATMNELTYSKPELTLTPEHGLSNLKAQHALAVDATSTRSAMTDAIKSRWSNRKVDTSMYDTTFEHSYGDHKEAHLDETYTYVKPTFGQTGPPELDENRRSMVESRGLAPNKSGMVSSLNAVHLPHALNTYPKSPR